MPVLLGAGRGLRVSVGDSSLMRVVSRIERTVEDAMLGALREGDVVWDLGANIGWFSLLAARAVGPTGRVIAFEPSPANAAAIKANAARNKLSITVVCAAVSDSSGWASFDDSESLTGRILTSGGSVVPTVTLDEWAAGSPAPRLVKIDIEGGEVAALAGASELLMHARPIILCETHNTHDEVVAFLRASRYEVTAVESPELPVEEAAWAHLLGMPIS